MTTTEAAGKVMNGAQALLQTLVNSDVDICFTNPGTSEMHFVAALDSAEGMRAVLALFEGVATGAADGYARIADKPATTLLHLGPGLGNGLANLHNARRARSPIVNIVGDHATYHKQYDAQLNSDIETVARNVSTWVQRPTSVSDVSAAAAAAVAAAWGPPGNVATLILPADTSWSDPATAAAAAARAKRGVPADSTVAEIADALRSGDCALLLGGTALRESALDYAGRISAATGARLLCETFPARAQRGAGLPSLEKLAYLGEMAAMQLDGLRHLIVVDAKAPVSFFAYPDKPSYLVPEGCSVHVLAADTDDAQAALAALADLVAGGASAEIQSAFRPDRPSGELTADAISQAIGALLPEGAIVSDESNTSGVLLPMMTAGAPQHDWLSLTGGSIGQGLPVAVGAAIAAPDRPVLALEADGSALYTIQSLWTMARENLDVTTVLYNNRSYAILNMELSRVGVDTPGRKALDMLDLTRPDIDFVEISRGLGVPAQRAYTAEEFSAQLERAIAEPGPHLIEAVVPKIF